MRSFLGGNSSNSAFEIRSDTGVEKYAKRSQMSGAPCFCLIGSGNEMKSAVTIEKIVLFLGPYLSHLPSTSL